MVVERMASYIVSLSTGDLRSAGSMTGGSVGMLDRNFNVPRDRGHTRMLNMLIMDFPEGGSILISGSDLPNGPYLNRCVNCACDKKLYSLQK